MKNNIKFFDKVLNKNITCENDLEKVKEVLNKCFINQYKTNYDYPFDSHGYDVWTYAISYIYNDESEI